MSAEPTHYARLGVEPDADEATIRAAWRERSFREHPDRNPHDPEGAHERFLRLAEAMDVLGDPRRRAAYDRRLGLPRRPGRGAGATSSVLGDAVRAASAAVEKPDEARSGPERGPERGEEDPVRRAAREAREFERRAEELAQELARSDRRVRRRVIALRTGGGALVTLAILLALLPLLPDGAPAELTTPRGLALGPESFLLPLAGLVLWAWAQVLPARESTRYRRVAEELLRERARRDGPTGGG